MRSLVGLLLCVACAEGGTLGDAGVATDAGADAGSDGATDVESGDLSMDAAPVVRDRLLLDNAGGTERLNFELSPDGRWATLNEREGRAGLLRPVLFRVEDDGTLSRRCAFEVALSVRGSMQVGEAAGASFAVGLSDDGRRFVVVTPRDEGPCSGMLEEVPVGLSAEATRELNNPYPVRGFGDARLVAFHRHEDDANRESVYLQDLDAAGPATRVWEATRPNARRSFGTFLSVARWPLGEGRFVAGRWVEGVAQAVETALGGGPNARVLTGGPDNKPDVFPFRAGGRGYLLTNDGGGPDGLLFAEAEDGDPAYVPVLTVPFDAA